MSELLTALDHHVFTVTLNRPDIHNAMSHAAMIEELVAACHEANANRDIRVMILTGAGDSFCAGGNIKDMRARSGMFAGSEAEIEQAYRDGIQRIPLALWEVEVPVIAAVNGAAVGAGCDMAMMCDLRLASSRARFAESFVKLGIIPGDGGAWFLPRVIGTARAAQMSLTGEMIDAHTALEWGMVNELCSPEALMPRVRELAATIAANPPLAVRETKRLLRASSAMELDTMLAHCAARQSRLHHSADHHEALAAFMEKRAGNYRGE